MTQDTRAPLVGAEVGQPGPGEQTCDRHDETWSIRGKSFQEDIRVGLHVAVHEHLAALVEEADGHGAGVEVDAAVKWVLGGGESPEVSSS
jgi:hypothetical protein